MTTITSHFLALLRRRALALAPIILLAAACCTALAAEATRDQPNIIVIFADDMGYGDVGAYNPRSKIPTPHMDTLAASGLRFTDAHTSSSVCTPSRYSLLTGRYSWRSRLESGVLDGLSPPLIEADRPTLASYLQGAGYETAIIGKWHLGMQWTRLDGSPEDRDRSVEPGFRPGTNIDYSVPITGGPLANGFGSFFGISASLDMAPYGWIADDRFVTLPMEELTRSRDTFMSHSAGAKVAEFEPEQVLPTLKRRTVDWIQRHLDQREGVPFFLYLPLNSPHLPVAPSASFIGTSGAGLYGDFVVETDDYVGAVVDVLRRNGALDDTLIIVTSDNGGLWHAWDPVEPDDVAHYEPTPRASYTRQFGHQSNANLRGTKADIWEGGHRVPFLVHWPRRIEKAVTAAPVEVTDIFATVAEVLGRPLPAGAAPDSFSFANLFSEPAAASTGRPFLVHHSIRGMFAIRQGDWKFVETRGSGGFTRLNRIEAGRGEADGQLFNLRDDIAETRNLYLDHPERVAHFRALLAQLKASVALRSQAGVEWYAGEPAPVGPAVEHVLPSGGFDVVVVAGQSNAVGRGLGAAEEPPELLQDEHRIFQLGRFDAADGRVIPATSPLQHWGQNPGKNLDRRGLALPFARRYVQTLSPDRGVLLVPVARGSSTILLWDREQQPFVHAGMDDSGPPVLWNDLVARTRQALAATPGNRLVAVLWQQGEADINAMANPRNGLHGFMTGGELYQAKLEELRAGLRAEFDVPDQPPFVFLIGECNQAWQPMDGTVAGLQAKDVITRAARAAAASDPTGASRFVSSAGISGYNGEHDTIHYSAEGARLLGARFFEVLRSR